VFKFIILMMQYSSNDTKEISTVTELQKYPSL